MHIILASNIHDFQDYLKTRVKKRFHKQYKFISSHNVAELMGQSIHSFTETYGFQARTLNANEIRRQVIQRMEVTLQQELHQENIDRTILFNGNKKTNSKRKGFMQGIMATAEMKQRQNPTA